MSKYIGRRAYRKKPNTGGHGRQNIVLASNAGAYTVGGIATTLTHDTALTTAQEITAEAIAPNSLTNHPLPLMAVWGMANYTSAWQMARINEGHHFLPAIGTTQSAVAAQAALNLPVSYITTQYEQELYTDPQYKNLPYPQNPNAWVGGVAQNSISPFGPIQYWQEIGTKWGSTTTLQNFQSWYPNPPKVMFLSNNEAARWPWLKTSAGQDIEQDQHYVDLYGLSQTDEFKKTVVAQGWIDRYRPLQTAWKNAMTNTNWKNNCFFAGYDAFGPPFLGRFHQWSHYGTPIINRIDPNPLMWDGGSSTHYLWDNAIIPNDFQVYSNQVQTMNLEFMLTEAHALHPSFWFEFSTWNGIVDATRNHPDYSEYLTSIGQTMTTDRYAGGVQFSMWIMRPRAVREWHWSNEALSLNQAYVLRVSDAVNRVYNNATLKSFWRSGTLVANTSRPHPYQSSIPSEYASKNRMFLLTTNLDPGTPWSLTTELPVFSLARVKGTTPNRQWLLYAFSPRQDRTNIQFTIPGYTNITAGATIAGAFYLVDEASGSVTSLGNGD